MPKILKVKFFYLLLGITLAAGSNVLAQTGVVAGKVTDAATNEILPGASIIIEEQGGKTTDMDGRYSLELPAGSYSITFEYIGFKPKKIGPVVLKPNEITELNIVLERMEEGMEAVVVTATARRESVSSVLSMQKNNSVISDGISVESIKRSPDSNVGEVLKRVSGASIQEDKFVVVRGLSDRYNIAMINGALLPSTEPDRRAFSFDVVPSNLIDNIVISKTASPDLPGDFSGGIVQVVTKDIPFRNFFNISAGIGYNSISTGKDFNIGILRPADYLAADDGTRALPSGFPSTRQYRSFNADPNPARRIEASKLMRNNYGDRYNGTALPSMNLQLNGGFKRDFNNGGSLGSVLSLVYKTSQDLELNSRRDYQTEDKTDLTPDNLFYNYRDTTYSFNSSIGLMANFTYKKANNKFSFRNLINRSFEQSNLKRSGFNYDNIQYIESTGAIAVQRSLISSQVEGEHLLSEKNNRIKWNLNYTLTQRNQPDYRVLPYSKSLDDVDKSSVPMTVVLRDTYRFWSELTDHAIGANVNYQQPLKILGRRSAFKTGLSSQFKTRDFSTRIFRYEAAVSSMFNQELLKMPAKNIFNDGNIYENGFVLNEITNNNDKYDAYSVLGAGYALIDGRFTEQLRYVAGVRIEHFNFLVNTADFSGSDVKVERSYLDVLPSLNLTYNLNELANLRLSVSKTVSRPEFREVSNFSYFDFLRNAQLKGNTKLKRSQITNLDLRYEIYPSKQEVLSASIFYKNFNNPIEQVVLNGSTPSNLILSFENSTSASSYGAEAEIRKNLEFLNSSLENFVFYINAAYIKSTVSFNNNFSTYDKNRSLQGLSPYLLNGGLQFTTNNNKLALSGLFNRIGPRISSVGFQGYPDIYENARSVIDFQAAVKVISGKGEVKLNISDLLNQEAVFYQNIKGDNNKAYQASKDRILYKYQYGTGISLGFSYSF